MPSKQVTETVNGTNDFVEELVAAINHNLQLKARPCACLNNNKQKRVSPYVVPGRTMCKKVGQKENTTDNCKYCKLSSKPPVDSCEKTADDPYEMLQDLLREGSLIKEAVKRLQHGVNVPKPRKMDFYDLDEVQVVQSPQFFNI